jgi:hypothetical protein
VFARAIDHGANALKIWIPAAAAGIVCVADYVAKRRPLAADLAFHCHDNSLPIPTKLNKGNSLTEFRLVRTRFDIQPLFDFSGFVCSARLQAGIALIPICPPESGPYRNHIEFFHSSHFSRRSASSAFSTKMKTRWFRSIASQNEICVDNIRAMHDTDAPFRKNNSLLMRGRMLLRLEGLSGVINPRSYPTEIIRELEHLLLEGVSASPDPGRKNFYDLKSRERAFFVHISPIDGQVVLIAAWLHAARELEPTDQPDASLHCTA